MSQMMDELRVGEETRLAERFMGKPVYAKLIDFGTLPAANSEKSVPHGVIGMDQYGIDNSRSYVAQGSTRHALFYPNTVPNAFWRAKMNEENVSISVGEERSTFTALICVWYTKTSDEVENGDGGGSGARLWESDWFNIAVNGAYTFQHNLNLENPWRVQPRIVGRMKQSGGGWAAGDIIFGDGSNYNGSSADTELGWAIGISATGARVTFGNSAAFVANNKAGGYAGVYKNLVQCKLLITY